MIALSRSVTFFFLFIIAFQSYGQSFFSQHNNIITLNNGVIKRELIIRNDSLICTSLSLRASSFNYIENSFDFSLLINDHSYNGFSGWKLTDVKPIQDSSGGNGMQIILQSKRDTTSLQVTLNYILYPNLPIIRKWISIRNTSVADMKIEALNMEDVNSTIDNVQAVVYHNYARMKQFGRFVGKWEDPLVIVHDLRNSRGIAIGNESPGVLKRTAYHTAGNDISAGLTQASDNFPFRKWLQPNQQWTSPKTFIALYANTDNGFDIVNGDINTFIVNYMRPKVTQLKEKPVFVYNTWMPFRTQITNTLIDSVAKAAAACGIEEFVIDDGWQMNTSGGSSQKTWGANYGDWLVDTVKLKHGLKAVFDNIKSLGMKPGLWISLASVTKDAQVFRDHPEWLVKNRNGSFGNIHYPGSADDGFYSASFGTGWKDYIQGKIDGLVKEYGLQYAKLDLAVVTSPYINNDSISGSYATDHPYYRDHNESFIISYERLLELFDALHQLDPDLFIDCTFESVGKLHLMDYAFAERVEGNWLSNIEEASPLGPLRVRQLAWWRSPVLPAASLVIGNLALNDSNVILSLKSLIGTLPIMLGDPRKLSEAKRKELAQWSAWMQRMQNQYDYMSYRKDLPGFGEPTQGSWDGWQRINFNTKKGGIFGVFKNAALETKRKVFLSDLDAGKRYVVRTAPDAKIIFKGSGYDLMNKGVEVELRNRYDGAIYEVGLE